MEILLGIILTGLAYLFFPLILSSMSHSEDKCKIVAIINAIIVFIIFKILEIGLTNNMKTISFSMLPALFWGEISYYILKKTSQKTIISKETNNDIEMAIILEKYKKINCKVCGKETTYNEYGTCPECHQKILKRLEEKENNEKENNTII